MSSKHQVVALSFVAALLLSCGSGDATRGNPAVNPSARIGREDPRLTEEQRAAIDELSAIGYAAGTQPATAAGVTVHVEGRAYEGLNFYSSGHGPEAVLMDMEGNVLHRWRRDFSEVWPDSAEARDDPDTLWWRRCRLLPNGEILAIFEGFGILELDWHSNQIWARRNGAHHDLDLTPGGDIWVLTREAHVIPSVHPDRPVLEDFASLLGPDGEEKRRFSLLEAFDRSSFRDVWREGGSRLGPGGDVFHTNAIEVLDGSLASRDPAFAKGNLLLSMLKLNAIAIADPEREIIVWARKGDFRKQHDPTIVNGKHLMLFDNQGPGNLRSRVLELDPFTMTTIWSYEGNEASPFFSPKLGTAQRLPNGNTLITESNNGRAFEVSPQGQIVWEFHNPHRTGDDGELVATLSEVWRLPASALSRKALSLRPAKSSKNGS